MSPRIPQANNEWSDLPLQSPTELEHSRDAFVYPSEDPTHQPGGKSAASVSADEDAETPHVYGTHPILDLPPDASRSYYDRSVWDRFGIYGILVLGLGTLVLLGSVAMLCYLWDGARRAETDEDPGEAWRNIVFSGWMARTITILAAIMRSAITAQAATITAMIAALFIESAGTPLAQLPILSIARAVTLSPTTLTWPEMASFRNPAGALYTSLIFATAALMMASQFMSTILLSDFRDVNIAERAVSALHNASSDAKTDLALVRINPFWSAPTDYWRFAEYHEPVPDDAKSEHVADTGATLHAALPWTDQKSRVNLRSYTGPVKIWDARVICFSPEITNLSVKMSSPSPWYYGYSLSAKDPTIPIASNNKTEFVDAADPSPTTMVPMPAVTLHNVTTSWPTPQPTAVEGSFTYDRSYPPLRPADEGEDPNLTFVCRPIYQTGATLCHIPWKSREGSLRLHESLLKEVATPASAIMVLNASFPASWSDSAGDTDAFFGLARSEDLDGVGWSLRRDGPWTGIHNATGHRKVSLSACFTWPGTYSANVSMNGTATTSEPVVKWAGADSDNADTLDVRRQLGATQRPLTHGDRGVLSMMRPPEERFPNMSRVQTGGQALPPSGISSVWVTGPEEGPVLTYRLPEKTLWARASGNMAHRKHTALFLDVVRDAGDPARALQALSTVFSQIQYYDESFRWTVGRPATYVMSGEASIPVRRAGLASVVGVVVAHFGVLGAALALFLTRTRATLLGNAWQAVAQVASRDTLPVLAGADDLKDAEVKRVLAGSAWGPDVAGVVRRRKNGRNEFGAR